MFKKYIFLLCFFGLTLFSQSANASELEESINIIEDKYNFSVSELQSATFPQLLTLLAEKTNFDIKKPIRLFITILILLVFVSIAKGLQPALVIVPGVSTLDTIINIVFVVIVITPITEISSELMQTIFAVKSFIMSFSLVFTTLLLSGGQIAAAGVYNTFFIGSLSVLTSIVADIIMPLINIYLALAISSSCVNSINFSPLVSLVSKTTYWLMLLISTIFVALLSFQTIVSQSADTLAIRAGKFLVGSGVPVIGRAIGDALSSLMGSVAVLKGTAGFTLIFAVLITFLPVLVKCAIYIALFTFTASLAVVFSSLKLSTMLLSISETFKLYLSSIFFLLMIIIISSACFIVVGGA